MKIPMALWPTLMPLLDQALDLPPAERESWLATQHLSDEVLMALRQLIADRARLDGGDFMAGLPKLDAVNETASPPAAQAGLFAGDMLGPYRLIRQLGQGGMSVVWLAERDDGQLRRHVAIKMPHAGPGQALLAERLRRERDILAALEHRHIARLYDVGVSPLGLPFLVLEYIEGLPLPTYCDEHRLNVTERLQLFLQVLSAVQYAHTKLVLHRDLKPSNILVNAQGEVKLLDFGIAKLIRDGETGAAPSTELTQHNGHVLTPDYAAPEQIAGSPLTTASDVYALGVILFELLTGQRPYRLPRGRRGALEEAILATDPRRPSQVWLDDEVQTHHPSAVTLSELAEHLRASPRRLSQLLRGDLDVIVCTALQKQASRRYATAEAFAQDIQHHLAKEPIAAQPDSRWYRTRKYVQRHALALSAVGAVVLALSVGLGVALWQAQQARQEAAKATAIKDFLVGLFENGDVEQPDALRKRQQTVEQLLVTSADALGTQLKDQPQVRVELQGVVGGLLHNLAITDAAIKLRRQRVEQLEAMHASVGEQAQAWRELADSQDQRGDAKGAKSSYERGLMLCKASNMEPRNVCYGLQVSMGHVAILVRDIPLARSLIPPALAALRESGSISNELAEALVAMGDLLSIEGDSNRSFALYEESIAVRGRIWGEDSTRLTQERYFLGMSLGQVGRFEQAEQELKKAYETSLKVLGKDNLSSAAIGLQLGRLKTMVGLQDDGPALVAHASRIIFAHTQQVDPRTLFQAYRAMGEVSLLDGRLAEAGPYLKEAMRLRQALGDALPSDGRVERALAWYLEDSGHANEARQVLLEAKEKLSHALGATHPYVHAMNEAIGSTYLSEANLAQAAQWLRPKDDAGAEQPSQGWSAWLMESRRFDEAAPFVMANYQTAVVGTPRQNQTRLVLYGALDQMARLKMGQGRPREAKAFYERAIQTLGGSNQLNPYLATTRARYGICLLALGDEEGARRQARLAAKTFRENAELAPAFMRPLAELEAELAGRASSIH